MRFLFRQQTSSWDLLTCYKLGEVCNPAAGVFFRAKMRNWDFLTCYKLGDVQEPPAPPVADTSTNRDSGFGSPSQTEFSSQL